jgi:hypothetical protein
MTILLLQSGPGRAGASATSAEVAQFLARTSGLDTTHTNAYTALINGLVADGVWAKLDALYVFATQDTTNALLNLVSTNYTPTVVVTPTFTADRGYNGTDSGSSLLNTNFNPVTASSPKFTQNSAHLSGWSVTDLGSGAQGIIGNASGASTSVLYPVNAGNTLYRINHTSQLSAANTSSAGFFLGNRSDANSIQGYKNGASVGTTTSATSAALLNDNMGVVGNRVDFNNFGSKYQTAAASIGSSLTATEATNFYNRLRTYMTAMGVP